MAVVSCTHIGCRRTGCPIVLELMTDGCRRPGKARFAHFAEGHYDSGLGPRLQLNISLTSIY